MIVTIAKRFTFDAAHHLPTLPPDHKCHRMHGHTYEVELQIIGDVQPNGMVMDYAEIAGIWQVTVHGVIDHRVLNDIRGLEVPTTEHVAAWIFCHVYPELARRGFNDLIVRVYESTTTWCEVAGNAGELVQFMEYLGL